MKRVRCPICNRQMDGASRADWPDFPFCSSRCRLIDLGRWLGEEYRFVSETPREEPAEPDTKPETP